MLPRLNYEVGLKGQPFDNLQMSIAVFYTDYSDLPYQVSTTIPGAWFRYARTSSWTRLRMGIEWESTWQVLENFRLYTTLGLHRCGRGSTRTPTAVAPLTPELTFSISPEFSFPLGEGNLTMRADYSFRDDMFGEPSSDPGRFTQIDSRDLINVDVTYEPADGDWSLSVYGNERHGRALRQCATERY